MIVTQVVASNVFFMSCSAVSAWVFLTFFFQAEDGIRDLVRSRGLGDVYKRQASTARGRKAPGRA